MSKIVQESFGEAIIQSVREFAKSDLPTIDQLMTDQFSHVAQNDLRRTLAETFYGARWIYKLGLALLVRDEEQMAHVRTQVVDYAAVCEGLLSDCLLHALQSNLMGGQKHKYSDFRNSKGKINWNVKNTLNKLSRQSFFWHIEVGFDEGIVDQGLCDRLHSMRKERNTVHIRSRTNQAFVGTSKRLFDTVLQTVNQTKQWRACNP